MEVYRLSLNASSIRGSWRNRSVESGGLLKKSEAIGKAIRPITKMKKKAKLDFKMNFFALLGITMCSSSG